MTIIVREYLDHNFLIYELWKKDCTIDEVSFDPRIPSTVGSYVRNFNKHTRGGEPIAFLPEREKLDEIDIAFTSIDKNLLFQTLLKWAGKGNDAVEKEYKLLVIVKILRGLKKGHTSKERIISFR